MKNTKSSFLLQIIFLFCITNMSAQLPLSAHNTVYIPTASSSYQFVNNDFAFYKSTTDLFAGVIITSLPAVGTLTYNGTAVNQTNVSQATVFTDRTKFAFVPATTRTATSFSFKIKDSKSVITALSYTVSVKYTTPVSKLVRTATTNYIDCKGLPYLLYGIQLRIDNYLGNYPYADAVKLSNISQYFEKTSLAGFRDAAVSLPWSYIETADNVFNFTMIDKFLTHANTYNLRLHLLWFGSNVCGSSSTATLPAYICNTPSLYPRIATTANAPLNFSSSNLIAKEVRAVGALMNYLAQKDLNKRVVMVQVENEPDNNNNNVSATWAAAQKPAVCHMMDTLGQVIHRSLVDVVTRVNFTGYTNDASDFGAFKGINIVGRDTYQDALAQFLIDTGHMGYPWNLNHTPENGAEYKNKVNLVLAAFDKGAGYINYELRSTAWFASQYDLGLYRSTTANDWIERDGTQNAGYGLGLTDLRPELNMSELKAFNEMIYKADKKIAKSPDSKNAAFNLGDAQGAFSETKSFSTYSVKYSTPVGGEAFALEDDNGDIILMSLKDNSSFTFQSLPINFHVSIGYFDELNTWHETSNRKITANNITLNAKEVALLTPTVYYPVSTSIAEVSKQAKFTVSKDQSTGLLKLNLDELDFIPTLIEVMTVDSHIVFSENINETKTSFLVPFLAHGLYLVKLSDKTNNKLCVSKLME